MERIEKEKLCPHGYPVSVKAECPSCKRLLEIYQDNDYKTLYRYDNPNTAYDDRREGIVSRKELIGSWFTDRIDDLATYIKGRQPGGRILLVRAKKDDMEKYDATKLPETKDMDIEAGNYIIPEDIKTGSGIEIPLTVEGTNPNKFIMKDWVAIDSFISDELSDAAILKRITEG